MRLILLLVVALLSGCASWFGNADYRYTTYSPASGKPTCKLTVDSGRVVSGVSVKACGDLEVTAEKLQQGNSAADVTTLLNTVLQLQAPPASTTPEPPK